MRSNQDQSHQQPTEQSKKRSEPTGVTPQNPQPEKRLKRLPPDEERKKHLGDIVKNLELIEVISQINNPKLPTIFRALQRLVGLIGEKCNNPCFDENYKEKHNYIPWKQLSTLRTATMHQFQWIVDEEAFCNAILLDMLKLKPIIISLQLNPETPGNTLDAFMNDFILQMNKKEKEHRKSKRKKSKDIEGDEKKRDLKCLQGLYQEILFLQSISLEEIKGYRCRAVEMAIIKISCFCGKLSQSFAEMHPLSNVSTPESLTWKALALIGNKYRHSFPSLAETKNLCQKIPGISTLLEQWISELENEISSSCTSLNLLAQEDEKMIPINEDLQPIITIQSTLLPVHDMVQHNIFSNPADTTDSQQKDPTTGFNYS